jgi:hypothetical protein
LNSYPKFRPIYARRLVNLEQGDIWVVQRCARERGLGGKGFSAALRLIIREWRAAQELREPPPAAPEEQTPPGAAAAPAARLPRPGEQR